jgi:hypothetical protein
MRNAEELRTTGKVKVGWMAESGTSLSMGAL